MSTSFSVCSDDYLNPKYGPNEFDYLDNADTPTTYVKYQAKQLEPVLTKVFLTQQAKSAEKNPVVVKKSVVEKKESFFDRHPGLLNTLLSIAFVAYVALMAIALLALFL